MSSPENTSFVDFLLADLPNHRPSAIPETVAPSAFWTIVQVHPLAPTLIAHEFIETSKDLSKRTSNIPKSRTPGSTNFEFSGREDFQMLVVSSDEHSFDEALKNPEMRKISKTIEEILKECVKNDRGLLISDGVSLLIIEPDRLFDYVRETWPEYLNELAEQGYEHCKGTSLNPDIEEKIQSQLSLQGWIDSYTIQRMRYEGKELTLISIEGKQGISKNEIEERSHFLAHTLGSIEPTIGIASTAWVPRITRDFNPN